MYLLWLCFLDPGKIDDLMAVVKLMFKMQMVESKERLDICTIRQLIDSSYDLAGIIHELCFILAELLEEQIHVLFPMAIEEMIFYEVQFIKGRHVLIDLACGIILQWSFLLVKVLNGFLQPNTIVFVNIDIGLFLLMG